MKNYTNITIAISNEDVARKHSDQMLNCPCSEFVEYHDYCTECKEAADFLAMQKLVAKHSRQIDDCLCTDVLDQEDYCPACTAAVKYFNSNPMPVRHPQASECDMQAMQGADIEEQRCYKCHEYVTNPVHITVDHYVEGSTETFTETVFTGHEACAEAYENQYISEEEDDRICAFLAKNTQN